MKKFLFIPVCAVIIISMSGCSTSSVNENNGNTEPEVTQQGSEDIQTYVQSVSEYLPSDSKYRLYNGYAEAGFEVKFKEKVQNNNYIEYKYVGAMCDGMGLEGESRTFNVTYTIGDSSVIEHVQNSDSFAKSENNVYSIIPDFIVLDGAIEKDNSWDQSIEINGETYVGTTTIISVAEDSFTTRTEITLDGYKNGVYAEERTYTKGKGITGFNNTPYGSDEDDTLIFGYGYSTENNNSVTGEI